MKLSLILCYLILSQSTCPTPAFSNQPAVRPFVPNTPPALRNVEQYQQSTLGSQLYPVSTPLCYILFYIYI